MDQVVERSEGRLKEFPVSFFAIVMGLSGLALAIRAAERAVGAAGASGGVASQAAIAAAIGGFLLVAAFYALKSARYPLAVAEEWGHPVRIAFFPAISISVLLIATALAPLHPEIARGIWAAGALAQAILTLSVVASWIGHRAFQPTHLSPAWFIPAVGNLIVPVGGAPLGFPELSWLFFSAGIIFWVVLLTLVVNRLVFHDPIPERLAPTLVILIAPPAVAFIAYYRLEGDIDGFARILLNGAYVFAGVVLTQVPKLLRLRFALSFWALSFPVAALSIASLVFAEASGSEAHRLLGLGFTALTGVIVAGLLVRTVLTIRAHEICRPE